MHCNVRIMDIFTPFVCKSTLDGCRNFIFLCAIKYHLFLPFPFGSVFNWIAKMSYIGMMNSTMGYGGYCCCKVLIGIGYDVSEFALFVSLRLLHQVKSGHFKSFQSPKLLTPTSSDSFGTFSESFTVKRILSSCGQRPP
jgi:hypothetical protein